jgi:hypothetical protein
MSKNGIKISLDCSFKPTRTEIVSERAITERRISKCRNSECQISELRKLPKVENCTAYNPNYVHIHMHDVAII